MAEVEFIRDPILDTKPMKDIFVSGIPREVTDEDFKAYIEEQAGPTSECSVIRKGDKPKLFAFITLESSEKVDELIKNKETLKLKDSALDVKRSLHKDMQGAKEKTKKLFIANVPKDNATVEAELKTYLDARHPKELGIIESIELVREKDAEGKKTEKLKGYGFINVSSEDMADKMAIQHATFEFGGRNVEIKKSVPNNGSGRGRGGAGGKGGQQQYGGYPGYGPPGYGYQQQWGGYAGYGAYGGYGYGGY